VAIVDDSGNRPSRLETSEHTVDDLLLSHDSFGSSVSKEGSRVGGVLDGQCRFCFGAVFDRFGRDFVAKTWDFFTLRGILRTGSRLSREL